MVKYRRDGEERIRTTVWLTKETHTLFFLNSKESLSEFSEEAILSKFGSADHLKEEKKNLTKKLKEINELIPIKEKEEELLREQRELQMKKSEKPGKVMFE